MTHRSISTSRRHFIAAAGMTALAAKASPIYNRRVFEGSFAFAASSDKLTVYSTRETAWIPVQTVSSEAPVSLVADHSTDTLHVLHAVSEYQGLPCGYVESFHIDKYNGQLKPLSRQPLSLSGILPSSMVLSPDGKALAVAIRGGAAYNLLPILKDGRPGRPQAIRKESGLSSALPSRPSDIAFNRIGDRIFTLDQGTSTLSVFSTQFEVLSRFSLPEASRFALFATYEDADMLFTIDAATGSLLSIRHHPADARLSGQPQVIRGNFLGPLSIHVASKTLFAIDSDGIHIFRIQDETGHLSPIQHFHDMPPLYKAQHLLCDPKRHILYLVAENGIWSSGFDPDCGLILAFVCAAPGARKITLL